MALRSILRASFSVADFGLFSGGRQRKRQFRRRSDRGFCAEPLERRLLLSTVTWVNTGGGDWNTASN